MDSLLVVFEFTHMVVNLMLSQSNISNTASQRIQEFNIEAYFKIEIQW